MYFRVIFAGVAAWTQGCRLGDGRNPEHGKAREKARWVFDGQDHVNESAEALAIRTHNDESGTQR